MSEAKHTPTPWAIFTLEDKRGKGTVVRGDGHDVLRVFRSSPKGRREGNTIFVLRACNNFDALLAACKYAKQFIDEYDPDLKLHPSLRAKLQAAIAAAEGED